MDISIPWSHEKGERRTVAKEEVVLNRLADTYIDGARVTVSSRVPVAEAFLIDNESGGSARRNDQTRVSYVPVYRQTRILQFKELALRFHRQFQTKTIDQLSTYPFGAASDREEGRLKSAGRCSSVLERKYEIG